MRFLGGLSGSGLMIQDDLDHGVLIEVIILSYQSGFIVSFDAP